MECIVFKENYGKHRAIAVEEIDRIYFDGLINIILLSGERVEISNVGNPNLKFMEIMVKGAAEK